MTKATTATCLVFCTCPDQDTASRITEELLTNRLAACVSQLPGVISSYRWKGNVEHDQEVLLLIKTTKTRYRDLQQELARMHPYELPEILAVPVSDGLPAYLDWVSESSAPE